MLQLDLAVDLDPATAFLSDLSRRHIPFAATRALSAVAAEARDAVRMDMPHRFTYLTRTMPAVRHPCRDARLRKDSAYT